MILIHKTFNYRWSVVVIIIIINIWWSHTHLCILFFTTFFKCVFVFISFSALDNSNSFCVPIHPNNSFCSAIQFFLLSKTNPILFQTNYKQTKQIEQKKTRNSATLIFYNNKNLFLFCFVFLSLFWTIKITKYSSDDDDDDNDNDKNCKSVDESDNWMNDVILSRFDR